MKAQILKKRMRQHVARGNRAAFEADLELLRQVKADDPDILILGVHFHRSQGDDAACLAHIDSSLDAAGHSTRASMFALAFCVEQGFCDPGSTR